MSNRILAITGPTSGIGKSTVIELASEYDILILLCRNVDKGESVKQLIQARHPYKRVDIIKCDLSDLAFPTIFKVSIISSGKLHKKGHNYRLSQRRDLHLLNIIVEFPGKIY